MFESQGQAAWLYTQLSGSAVPVYGRVYEGAAPARATKPYVAFSLVSALDEQANARMTTDALWQVLVWAQAETYNAVAPIAANVDDQLSEKIGTATIGTVSYVCRCTRQETLRQTDVVGGVMWRAMGGMYRIIGGVA